MRLLITRARLCGHCAQVQPPARQRGSHLNGPNARTAALKSDARHEHRLDPARDLRWIELEDLVVRHPLAKKGVLGQHRVELLTRHAPGEDDAGSRGSRVGGAEAGI